MAVYRGAARAAVPLGFTSGITVGGGVVLVAWASRRGNRLLRHLAEALWRIATCSLVNKVLQLRRPDGAPAQLCPTVQLRRPGGAPAQLCPTDSRQRWTANR